MHGALDGVRVVDLAQGIAGPYAAMLLAEQGADTLKVEPPDGDRYRGRPGFHVLNRSKRGLVIDFRSLAGRQDLQRLLATADVLIYDGSPRQIDELELSYAELARQNHGLVYCWMPPFGSAGPHAERFPDDALVAAVDGVMSGQFSAAPGPTFITLPLSSYGAALLAAGATCAALHARTATGHGQLVEVSWLAGGFALQTGKFMVGEGITRLAEGAQNPLGPLPVYRIFRASDDQYLFIACGHAGFFHRFCLLIDHPELISDPRFENAPWGLTDPNDRRALAAIIEPIVAAKTRDEWLALLTEADIPCAPIMTRAEYLRDPQVLHNGMRVEIDDPKVGPTIQMGTPLVLHGTPGGISGPAPRLGNAAPDSTVGRDPAAVWKNQARAAGTAASTGPAAPARDPSTYADGPLAGIRVVDLSGFIAGALCPMFLADWGADVIKVEGPDGDPFRTMGFGFLGWNRGKRGIVVDLKQPEGQEIVHELIRHADVVVENYRPGVAERLRVDYETVRGINPRAIYSTMTAFGRSGPYVAKPGFDPLLQARSGAMAAQGGVSAGHSPVFLTAAICDYGAALLSAFGIAAALISRDSRDAGASGQRVETMLASAAMAMQAQEFLQYGGMPPALEGGPAFRGPLALHRVYPTSDGWIMLAARDATDWAALAGAIGRPELLHRFTAKAALAELPDGELARDVEAAFAGGRTADWLEKLDRAGVPAAPVLGSVSVFEGQHVSANDLLAEHDHPRWGRVRQTGQLTRFSDTHGRVGPVAPLLGQHTVEVLREAGLDGARIDDLLRRRVVVQA